MVIEHKADMWFYALMATLGSVAGCLVLYAIGRRGGEAIVSRRFGGSRMARAMALTRRYGVLAIAVPSILPPPAPFKAFVLMAGVSRVPRWQFTSAIFVGRGLRYFGEGWLAVRYGEQAIQIPRAERPDGCSRRGGARARWWCGVLRVAESASRTCVDDGEMSLS